MKKLIETVSIVGMGFVGLTTAAFFASRGFNVTGIDVDKPKIEQIRNGTIPFYEEDLEPLVQTTTKSGNLKLSFDYNSTIENTDMTMIAVGTPSDDHGRIDLKFIKSAAHSIGQALHYKDEWHLVVVKSTVIPGTARNVVGKIIAEESDKKLGTEFGLCSNPEFLREGTALHDSINPDRIVIGECNEVSGQVLEQFYKQVYKDSPKIYRQNLETAEMVKYVANSFLALKISYANEIANICEHLPGVDVVEVMKSVTSDFRINPYFFGAGLGFGGSCFPKDVSALLSFANTKGYSAPILNSVLQVNNNQPLHAVNIIENTLGSLKDKKIALLGLAFKQNTSDMREAPSIKLVKHLLAKGANNIHVCDPKAEQEAKQFLPDSVHYGTPEHCLNQASACILVTDWPEYANIPPQTFQNLMIEPKLLLDGRRIFDPPKCNEYIMYRGIGLGALLPENCDVIS